MELTNKKPKKAVVSKAQLIDNLLEISRDNAEFNKHFTKDRLKRGFTVAMLTYMLNEQINNKAGL